jgi:peptidoglycan/xylan/chitin deacetylase (PgdA/CDA1 family)
VSPPDIVTSLGRLTARLRRRLTGIITHVATAEPVVALTFDDGPHPAFTPAVLEILARHDARATFFMIGVNARRHPEVVQAVSRAGHAIGNHSWDHSIFPLLTGRARRSQLRACARALAPYGRRLFRPPHGYYDVASQLHVLSLGYTAVNWSVDVDDWCTADVDRMRESLLTQTRPGSIVLLHDALCDAPDESFADRRPMLLALDAFLEHRAGRFRFVTIPELLRYGRAQRQGIDWFKKSVSADRGRLEYLESSSTRSNRQRSSH